MTENCAELPAALVSLGTEVAVGTGGVVVAILRTAGACMQGFWWRLRYRRLRTPSHWFTTSVFQDGAGK